MPHALSPRSDFIIFHCSECARKPFSVEESQTFEGSFTAQKSLPSTVCWNQELLPRDLVNWQVGLLPAHRHHCFSRILKYLQKLQIEPCCLKSCTFGWSWETGRRQQLAYILWRWSVGSHAGTAQFPESPQLWGQKTLPLVLSHLWFCFVLSAHSVFPIHGNARPLYRFVVIPSLLIACFLSPNKQAYFFGRFLFRRRTWNLLNPGLCPLASSQWSFSSNVMHWTGGTPDKIVSALRTSWQGFSVPWWGCSADSVAPWVHS